MRTPTVTRALLGLAAALALTAVWLTFDNPDIDGTSRGDAYTCLAPWDTVLNRADNVPGGDPPPDSDSIAARCRDAGTDRFVLAAVAAGAAVAVVLGVLTLRPRRPRDISDTGSRDPRDG